MDINNYTFYKEKKKHGNSTYPFTIYKVRMPETFYQFPLHYHGEVELIHVSEGKGIITVNLKPYVVTAGTIAFISPGILHSMEQCPGEPFVYRNFIFDLKMVLTHTSDESTLKTLLPIMANKIYFPVIIDKQHPLNVPLTAYISTMQQIHDTRLPGYELAIKSQIMLIIYLLTSNNQLLTDNYYFKFTVSKLKKVLFYISRHYEESISIQDAAAIFGSSPSHFMRFFKNTTGSSFIQYLNDYRLNIAQEQLLTTSCSILDIAVNAGFNNLSYFNRMFKNKFQESPSSYRKKHSFPHPPDRKK
ncbi:AraC family transcriptional regulator [Anaerocolumna cellulosilytica]|uniref:AraC family transcriptional regulator n=1 Tax=Anaerocolumna cellulosilytica TaxID=433286 RepID=A0A6S6R792_9FIRM|nr:AraC family transcriptional regulator [Anaerocolumna cellulosilytica]MBB5193904.1 AraC-like DNA-binding protein [Anaerocolumna cellulosilytica]BCJ94881.1 AraC family transcriptional regulator [Anaerocolumna cellulosilytica]